jgi:hypothetical protein
VEEAQEGSNMYFSYSRPEGWLEYSSGFLDLIQEHRSILNALITLRWVEFLEKFNDAPRLVGKVGGIPPSRRTTNFRELFLNFPELFTSDTCWLCGKPLDQDTFTLDHVVPFSFQYGDDLWNLVPAHKHCNSAKGDRLGDMALIKRVRQRNEQLLERREDAIVRKIMEPDDQFVAALEEAHHKAQRAGYRTWNSEP